MDRLNIQKKLLARNTNRSIIVIIMPRRDGGYAWIFDEHRHDEAIELALEMAERSDNDLTRCEAIAVAEKITELCCEGK